MNLLYVSSFLSFADVKVLVPVSIPDANSSGVVLVVMV